MFGGANNNAMLPVFLEENQFQFSTNTLPQLQLFGEGEFLVVSAMTRNMKTLLDYVNRESLNKTVSVVLSFPSLPYVN